MATASRQSTGVQQRPSSAASTASSTISLGGVSVQVQTTANPVVGPLALVSKAQRQILASQHGDKLLKVQSECCSKIPGVLFKTPSLKADDTKQLQDFFQIDSQLKGVVERLTTYDLSLPFTIIFPYADAAGNITPQLVAETNGSPVQIDLMVDYASLKISEVATSSQWYRQYTTADMDLSTDLDWSYRMLKANIESKLMMQLQQQYDQFPLSQQGGPLLLILLLKSLLHTNEAVVRKLFDLVKTYKIRDQAGENIEAVCSLLKSISTRIWFAKNESFPDRYHMTILEVLQTSSVDRFNEVFKEDALKAIRANAVSQANEIRGTVTADSGLTELQKVEDSLALAQSLYQDLVHQNRWTVRDHPRGADGAKLLYQSGKSLCWNCERPNCNPKICPHAKDAARIARNKKAFFEAKSKRTKDSNQSERKSEGKKSTSSARKPNKWAAPKDDNDHNRMIAHPDGSTPVPYKWNRSTSRWDKQESPSANTSGANSSPDSESSIADLRAKLANLQAEVNSLS